MAFLGPTELKKTLSKELIITDGNGNNVYNEKRVEEAAYALSLGSECYRTDNKERKIEILDEKSRTVEINPGQFTLLMTDEYVCIPKHKLAFISIKAKQKLKGLINVSGFHVDPGFEGKLLFSVYNAGPSTITLETKKPYFLIWFANLESEAINGDEYTDKNHHQGQKNIPLDYVDVLKQGDLTSPKALYDKLIENKNELEKKIDDKNRKVLNNEYILKAIVGILIAIFIRYLFVEVPKEYYIQQIERKDSTIIQFNRNIREIEKKILYLYQQDSIKSAKLKDVKHK